jgi:hypothetical protein
MNNIIKSISIITQQGVAQYFVDSIFGYSESITKIEDKSIQFQNHIDYVYRIYSGEKLLSEIINCPVEIKYF